MHTPRLNTSGVTLVGIASVASDVDELNIRVKELETSAATLTAGLHALDCKLAILVDVQQSKNMSVFSRFLRQIKKLLGV